MRNKIARENMKKRSSDSLGIICTDDSRANQFPRAFAMVGRK